MKTFCLGLALLMSLGLSINSFASGAGTVTNPGYISELEKTHQQAANNAQKKSLQVINEYFARGPEGIFVINDEKSDWLFLKEANAESFEVISARFAKDKDNIFSGFYILEGADRETFVVVSGEHGYAADTDRVYGPEFVLKDAEPDTFRMFNKNYAQDIANIFFRGVKLKGADAGSFEALNESYARDEDNVYYLGKKVRGADPESFETLGLYRAKDKNTSYFEGRNEKENTDLDELFEDSDEDEEDIESGEGGSDDDPIDSDDSDADDNDTEDDNDGAEDSDDDNDDSDSEDDDDMSDVIEAGKGKFAQMIKSLTGKDLPLKGIHGAYSIFFIILGLLVLALLYQMFSRRMGDNVSLIRSIINIVVGSILAAVIFMIIKKVTDVTGTYSPALVFFITLFVILLLLGIKTFASFIKNILVTLLTIIIGFVLLMLVIFVLDSFVDLPALLGRLDNPLAFTNTTLVIGSTILLTIIYHMTTRLGWITSFFRSFISVIVSIVLVLLLQNLFGLAGMLWSVVIFHVFLAIFLFIIGLRGTDHRFIYGAQVGRVAFIHFVIMFVLFLVLRAVIG